MWTLGSWVLKCACNLRPQASDSAHGEFERGTHLVESLSTLLGISVSTQATAKHSIGHCSVVSWLWTVRWSLAHPSERYVLAICACSTICAL